MKTLDDSLDVSNIDDSYKEAVKCKVCDIENECVENIKKHMEFNHEHSKIICQKGDYVLENKPRLLKHMRVVHEVCKNEVSTNANKSPSMFVGNDNETILSTIETVEVENIGNEKEADELTSNLSTFNFTCEECRVDCPFGVYLNDHIQDLSSQCKSIFICQIRRLCKI